MPAKVLKEVADVVTSPQSVRPVATQASIEAIFCVIPYFCDARLCTAQFVIEAIFCVVSYSVVLFLHLQYPALTPWEGLFSQPGPSHLCKLTHTPKSSTIISVLHYH